MSVPNTPTLGGFLLFIRNVMKITTGTLPDSDPVIEMAFAVALAIVNPGLATLSVWLPYPMFPPPTSPGGLLYTLAVYNLGGSNLINYATDTPPSTYFEDLRTLWNIGSFVPGVVQSAADVSTSTSLLVQDAAKNFTLANLQQLKDPWGRRYLAIAQSYGPDVWGLT